jgi:Zn-dependent protease with chaperone function
MGQIDFDLARYIIQRKGQVVQRARDGAAYSYSREIKVRRNLAALRPVAFAIDVTSRQWRGSARGKLLESAERAQAGQHERVYRLLQRAAQAMSLDAVPSCYVSDPAAPVGAFALGTDDDTVLVIHPSLLEGLDDGEICALLGSALSYVQNNLVPYSTALYYLEHDAMLFVRWIVKPAVFALRSWQRRAQVTADRGAMIAARSMRSVIGMLLKTVAKHRDALPADAFADASEEVPPELEPVLKEHPDVARRIFGLKTFSRSNLYHQLCQIDAEEALTTDQVDAIVAEKLGH